MQSALVTTGLVLSNLLIAMPGIAQPQSKYVDLRRRGSAPANESDSSRNCGLGSTRMLVPSLRIDAAEGQPEPEAPYAMVTDSQASLWMHMPYTPEEFKSMEIKLWDDDIEDYVYTGTVTDIDSTPGIVGITLPDDATQAGKRYRWTVKISYDCDAGDGTTTTGIDKKTGFVELGNWGQTWYSTMVQAARRRCGGESVSDWSTLLSEIEAVELATLPASACLSPANTWVPED